MNVGTIGEFTSRVRNQVKAVKQDAFLTDRSIYSLIKKHSSWLMKRQDSSNQLMNHDSIFQVIGFVELEDVDKVQAGCRGILSECPIKRTVDKLPSLLEGYSGPLLRRVSSLDGSDELQPVAPSTYVSMTKLKTQRFNKQKYYWFLEGYLYIPNVEWDAVMVEGVFEDDVSGYACKECGETANCTQRQNQKLNIPLYLHGELENHVMNDIRMMLQVPADLAHDKNSVSR